MMKIINIIKLYVLAIIYHKKILVLQWKKRKVGVAVSLKIIIYRPHKKVNICIREGRIMPNYKVKAKQKVVEQK